MPFPVPRRAISPQFEITAYYWHLKVVGEDFFITVKLLNILQNIQCFFLFLVRMSVFWFFYRKYCDRVRSQTTPWGASQSADKATATHLPALWVALCLVSPSQGSDLRSLPSPWGSVQMLKLFWSKENAVWGPASWYITPQMGSKPRMNYLDMPPLTRKEDVHTDCSPK